VIFVNKRVTLLLAVLALAACAHARTTAGPVPNPSLDLPQGNLTVAGSGGRSCRCMYRSHRRPVPGAGLMGVREDAGSGGHGVSCSASHLRRGSG